VTDDRLVSDEAFAELQEQARTKRASRKALTLPVDRKLCIKCGERWPFDESLTRSPCCDAILNNGNARLQVALRLSLWEKLLAKIARGTPEDR
jgi:hypothetical protein